MKLCFGENLRNYRLQKGLTQEQFAEMMDVSPQTISRWETGVAFPDVIFLVGIAMYFEVSVDTLLGMNELCDAKALDEIHCCIHNLVQEERYSEAVEIVKNSLKIYPNNSGLLIELCELSVLTGDTDEAIVASEEVLRRGDLSMKSKSTVTVSLLYAYLRDNRKEDATRLLQTLPHMWESREWMSAELHDGEEYTIALKGMIKQLLGFCFEKITSSTRRQYGVMPTYIQLGMNVDLNENTELVLNTIQEFLGV